MSYRVTDFVKGFFKGTLGNKKVHSAYSVLDGDHCQVLVRKGTQRGRPTGNTVVAVDLSTTNTRLVFIIDTSCFRWRAREELSISNYQSFPQEMFKQQVDILKSGVVDETNSHALIEIGDTPYLFSYEMHGDTGFHSRTAGGCPKVVSIEAVPNRVSTVKEAIELLKTPDGRVVLLNKWEATAMPHGFKPPELDKKDMDIITTPLDPLQHGYTLDECIVLNMSLTPMVKVRHSLTMSSKETSWYDANKSWDDAAQKFKAMFPEAYSGIDVKKSKYSYGSEAERVGAIVVSPIGNYVKGTIYDSGNREIKEDLLVWHKLEKMKVKWVL